MELLNGISLERAVQTFGSIEPARTVYSCARSVIRWVKHTRAVWCTGYQRPTSSVSARSDDDYIKVLDFGSSSMSKSPKARC